LYFQTLKHKNKSIYFVSGKFLKELPQEAKYTWDYYPEFKDKSIEYASLYIKTDKIDKLASTACPFIDQYKSIKSKLKSHFISIKETKINTDKVFIYDLIPNDLLKQYCFAREEITKYIFDNYAKPYYYDTLLPLVKIIEEIKHRSINGKSVIYDPFKSKTGRLVTKKGSFPILTLSKERRKDIYPENDLFLSLDYNSFEARVLLALSGEKQPEIDIHDWNCINIFNGEEREKAKKDFFAWLYNPEAKNEKLEKIYKKEVVLDKYYNKFFVSTPYKLTIPANSHYALSYLIQSTASYLFYEQIAKVNNLLRNKKTFISFMIHDNLILDLDKKDKSAIKEIVDIFSETRYGRFLATIKVGKNFGEMRKICLK
jgi:hypothetical protein